LCLLTFACALQHNQGVYGNRRTVGPDLQGIDIHLSHLFVLQPDFTERQQYPRQKRLINGGFSPKRFDDLFGANLQHHLPSVPGARRSKAKGSVFEDLSKDAA
jgi:hypothetical protein